MPSVKALIRMCVKGFYFTEEILRFLKISYQND